MTLALTRHAIELIADRFVEARKSGQALVEYPGPFPTGLSDGYRIQAAAIAKMGSPVLGWKVAAVGPELADEYGASRIAGPVFRMSHEPGPEASVPLFRGSYAAAEAELQLRIGGLPSRGVIPTLDEVAQCIDQICIGIEAAGSPFPEINQRGPAVTVSDFGNNNGLVIGPAIDRDDLASLTDIPVNSYQNSRLVGSGVVSSLEPAFAAAKFLFEIAKEHGLPLVPGQWISTGALTGAHPVSAGDRFVADLGSLGSVSCRFG